MTEINLKCVQNINGNYYNVHACSLPLPPHSSLSRGNIFVKSQKLNISVDSTLVLVSDEGGKLMTFPFRYCLSVATVNVSF